MYKFELKFVKRKFELNSFCKLNLVKMSLLCLDIFFSKSKVS